MARQLKMLVLIFALCAQPAAAQICGFNFTRPSTCSGEQCSVLINFQPAGEARVVADPAFGTGPAINFAANSAFEMGDDGRMNFGDTGGIEATFGSAGVIATCVDRTPGLQGYSVNMTNGGWFELSADNRMVFGENNVVTLADGSVIEGRLILSSDGSVTLSSQGGDAALPNVDIEAADGVTVSGQGGGVELGEVDAGEGDVTVNSEGPVAIAAIGSGGAVNIDADGDITIDAIGAVDTIDLAINALTGGTITVGDFQVSDITGPVGVTCNTALDCEDFVPGEDDGSGSGDGGDSDQSDDNCDDPDRDPDAPNACVAGGAVSLWWLLVLVAGVGVVRRTVFSRRPDIKWTKS